MKDPVHDNWDEEFVVIELKCIKINIDIILKFKIYYSKLIISTILEIIYLESLYK